MTVTIRNRQRLLKVNRTALQRLATQAFPDSRPVTIVLVTDRAIAKLNEQFHHVTGPTDILTFDYGDEIELVISTEHARANARRFRTTPQRELARYVIHGLLHCHGHNDHTPAQRRRMRTAERRLLRQLKMS